MHTIPLVYNCVLRPITSADAEQLMEVKNNRAAAEWLEKDNNGYSLDDIRAWIAYHQKKPENLILAIEDRTNELIIGHAGLYDMDTVSGTCTFGILIGRPEYWHKGIGKAATVAMTDIAFHTPGIHTVRLHVLNEHTSAINMYMAVGFERVALLKDHSIKQGIPKDVLLMEKHHYGINDTLLL